MNVKYLFEYVEQCKINNVVGTWQGLKDYHNENKTK